MVFTRERLWQAILNPPERVVVSLGQIRLERPWQVILNPPERVVVSLGQIRLERLWISAEQSGVIQIIAKYTLCVLERSSSRIQTTYTVECTGRL